MRQDDRGQGIALRVGQMADAAARMASGAQCGAQCDAKSGAQSGIRPRRSFANGPGAGFTLIEVLIVLAVLGVLAAAVYPSYGRQVIKTRRAEAQLALLDAMQRQEQYRALHHSYAAFSAASTDANAQPFRWWFGATPAASAHELDAYACPGQGIAACVVVRARPGTARVDARFSDPECGALTLSSAGEQAATGPSAHCWP